MTAAADYSAVERRNGQRVEIRALLRPQDRDEFVAGQWASLSGDAYRRFFRLSPTFPKRNAHFSWTSTSSATWP